ncbi:MAG: type II toxin-antitoxin system HigB family toxin [Thermodesulfobacteriota bacterium]|nr:type II toxin-antitoxin system HigB family toxin [Thermodesulfobacteriota bacterium]
MKRIISIKKLREFWDDRFPDSEQALKAWYAEAKSANWQSPTDIKAQYGNASILKRGRVVFNICGNKYKLIVKINFSASIVYIRFVGTHKEYDTIDAGTI